MQNEHQAMQNEHQVIQNKHQAMQNEHQAMQNNDQAIQNEHQAIQNNQKIIYKMEEKATKKRKSYYITEQKFIQNVGILFENLNNQEDLKAELAEYGYDDTEVAKGKALYDKALEEYQKNIREGQEETTSYKIFTDKINAVSEIYRTDRKKARVVFKDANDTLVNLRLKGKASQSIANMIDDMKVFYTTIQQNEDLFNAIKRLKITTEHIAKQVQGIADTEKAYADYTKEKGENQQATKNKNQAFANLDKWVREFYAVAKIALEDQPQLLESIAKFVRS